MVTVLPCCAACMLRCASEGCPALKGLRHNLELRLSPRNELLQQQGLGFRV